MNSIAIFILLIAALFAAPCQGETHNSSQSVAFARFAQLGNSCIAAGRITKNANMKEVEDAISAEFKGDYLNICGPLLDGFGEVEEVFDMTNKSTSRILAFSKITKPAQSIYSRIIDPSPDGRYVIYSDGEKFLGQFFPMSEFERLMKKQGSDVNQTRPFRFPALREQKLNPPRASKSTGISYAPPPIPLTKAAPSEKVAPTVSDSAVAQKEKSEGKKWTGTVIAIGVLMLVALFLLLFFVFKLFGKKSV